MCLKILYALRENIEGITSPHMEIETTWFGLTSQTKTQLPGKKYLQ